MSAESTSEPLRVLCLEDCELDSELLRERLAADGFDVDMSVAADRAEYCELIAAREFDIILADYSLPDFDAPGALEVATGAGVRIPFICVSGTVTEEQALELLRHGAVDYILKSQIGKLGFSVRRALKSAAEQAALRSSQERFQKLFEHMGDPAIVHDEEILLANPAALRTFGYDESADIVGKRLETLVCPGWMPAVEHVFDKIRESGRSVGLFEMCFLRADGAPWYAEVTMSPLVAEGRIVFESTLRDLTERRAREEELEEYRLTLEAIAAERGRSLEVARDALASVTAVISRTVEIRDPYTAGHQRRVATLATAIAEELKMPGIEIEEIAIAAAMHDIGKVSIPAEILSKPARLTEHEFELVKSHSQAGYDIIASAQFGGVIPVIVLQHHERCDGSGYPGGLVGDQLLPASKVLMVADVVEAMASHRPYRTALGVDAARDEIAAHAGVQFDAAVVEACLAVLDGGFVFEEVRL